MKLCVSSLCYKIIARSAIEKLTQSFTEKAKRETENIFESMENMYNEIVENGITEVIIGKAIEIHKKLGPGLLESAYQECLFYELDEYGYKVEKEKYLPITYKKLELNHGYRIDILVEDKIVVEIKAVEKLNEVHTAQLLTYLKLGGYGLGLLINFNVTLLKKGIRRISL